jgi:hypothetical protein
MLYDETAGALSTLWSLGRHLGGFDAVVPARSWSQALDALAALPPVVELQAWMHGRSGAPLIEGRRLDTEGLHELAASCRFHLARDPVVWWRACDVFSRGEGAEFALAATRITGASHVGHTRIVSWPWPVCQSGGYALRPGDAVWWDPYEGTKEDGSSRGSHPFAPHTCLTSQMRVPRSWWRP